MTKEMLFYNCTNGDEISVNGMSSNVSSGDIFDSIRVNADSVISEDEPVEAVIKTKKRLRQISEGSSESENENEKLTINGNNNDTQDTSCEDDGGTEKNGSNHTSRIRMMSSSDDDSTETGKYDFSRIKNKKSKLREKFRNLVSKHKQCSTIEVQNNEELDSELNQSLESENSDEGLECNKIKQTFKEKHMVALTSVCDPDSSDDDNNGAKRHQNKLVSKSTKVTSAKPMQISAKQAVENMRKIKSESSRMLREKEVSLPYHRPKALSLKDIMTRQKPALAPDGKVLSVKMTAEQLHHYALQLEQRQKEMIELCKSDTDEDDLLESRENEQKVDLEVAVEKKTEGINHMLETMKTSTIVNEDNLNKMDTDVSISENFESIECSSTVGSVLEDKDKNDGLRTSTENVKEVELIYNECNKEMMCEKDINHSNNNSAKSILNQCEFENNKDDSQTIELQYDSEKIDSINWDNINRNENENSNTNQENDDFNNDFLENVMNIDEIIEKCEDRDNNKQVNNALNTKPKLTGGPGMVIDLEDNSVSERKLSGVEILKERYKYFARLKSLEEQEKDREKKYKPGVQHLKLKQELEEQIAEQRSIEWTKRLEYEKQQQSELNSMQDDKSDTDDIEKLEAKIEKLNDSHVSGNETSESEEEDICEDDCIIKDKPRKKNPMINDEAEESDIEEDAPEGLENNIGNEDNCIEDNEDFDASDEDSSEDESDSESDQEEQNNKPRKGRILKAFEDSDDEEMKITNDENKESVSNSQSSNHNKICEKDLNISGTQDEELQLAQVPKIPSEELIVSQVRTSEMIVKHGTVADDSDKDLGSQTFSITNSENGIKCLDKLVAEETAVFHSDNFNERNLYMECSSQYVDSQQEFNTLTESQEIGSDIIALCTGKFYDNPFVSQIDNFENEDKIVSTNIKPDERESVKESVVEEKVEDKERNQEKLVLSSILEELHNPRFESPKKYKYFVNVNTIGDKENLQNTNNGIKKKFIIDSDEETNIVGAKKGSKMKNKKRKHERRALQFSDDEEDFEDALEETEAPESDIEEDVERIVEYDSEENEVEVQPQKVKKKRVAGDFFEQEAELTSEDEWIGSGDEDEAGLDRMEREEGDDEVFHEGKLRNELGQIHMRDVLDQDKREVRLLQELLFEDGDLGDGHRQRKFRWRNADDVEETGNALDEFAETQEEEFESEEMWRKQRHEREVFLRKMKGDEEDLHNTSINRTTMIKANLCSRTMSNFTEANTSGGENAETEVTHEKKTHKDIPSPKKPFSLFQQNYHGSLLSRGKGALARLAALATPLVGDGDSAPKVSASTNRRNFVFAALSQDEVEPKVLKRKAGTSAPSPVLIKKMKMEEKQKHSRSSLFDYLEV